MLGGGGAFPTVVAQQSQVCKLTSCGKMVVWVGSRVSTIARFIDRQRLTPRSPAVIGIRAATLTIHV